MHLQTILCIFAVSWLVQFGIYILMKVFLLYKLLF